MPPRAGSPSRGIKQTALAVDDAVPHSSAQCIQRSAAHFVHVGKVGETVCGAGRSAVAGSLRIAREGHEHGRNRDSPSGYGKGDLLAAPVGQRQRGVLLLETVRVSSALPLLGAKVMLNAAS